MATIREYNSYVTSLAMCTRCNRLWIVAKSDDLWCDVCATGKNVVRRKVKDEHDVVEMSAEELREALGFVPEISPTTLALAQLSMNIIEFEQYLRFMEGFLSGEFEKPYRSLEDLRTAMHQSSNTLTRDEGEVEIAPEEYYALARYEQLDNFASILRRSFFVTLYTFLESQLMDECRFQSRARDDITLTLSDIDGRGIRKAKIYLCKVLGVRFPFDTSPEWREIQEYARLRNCIVHNEGRLDERVGSCNAKNLRKYLEHNQFLFLHGSEIVFKKGFCEDALKTVGNFLYTLHQLLYEVP